MGFPWGRFRQIEFVRTQWGIPMTKENGFLPLRRGLWEHVRDGRMSMTAALTFIYICSQADTRTGIWKGSSKSLAGELGMKERTARDVLEKMEHGGYIRRFTVPGRRHTCYPILVHKFPITQGEHNGEQLNALESKSPTDLAYFSRQQDDEHGVEYGVEHSAAQRRIENRKARSEKNKEDAPASPSPSASSLPTVSLQEETQEAGFEAFWECWPQKQARTTARKAWLKIPLAEYPPVMAGVEKWKKSDQWTRGIIPHAANWLNQKRWLDEDVPERGANSGNHGAAAVKPEPDKYANVRAIRATA